MSITLIKLLYLPICNVPEFRLLGSFIDQRKLDSHDGSLRIIQMFALD